MASIHEKEVVLAHALLNEDNLTIALMIGAAYEELCHRVISSFLAAAEKQLATK